MKWNSRALSLFVATAVMLAAAAGVTALRVPLVADFSSVRERSDVYALPEPEQVAVLSLGYRAALADYLFAHVLVWHGLHFQQKRRLDFAAEYLDTIATLDPTFRDPYYFGDTLIAIQPIKPRREDYVRARRLLERGMAARPFDTELWLSSGQFMAYVAAPWLDDPKEQEEWRLAGARRARACMRARRRERERSVPLHHSRSLVRKSRRARGQDQFSRTLLTGQRQRRAP